MSLAPITVIDGGLSAALEELGADISGSAWTARALHAEPAVLELAHRAFVEAGAGVVTTASYQCAPDDEAGLRRATVIARQAAGSAPVAASVGPFGATLANGSEYHGNYGVDLTVVAEHHRRKLDVLMSSVVDLFAVETQPRADEARIIAEHLESLGAPPAWFSFTFADDPGVVRTCGGDSVGAILDAVGTYRNVVAVGVNCTAPQAVTGILAALRAEAPNLALIAYPNHGGRWVSAARTWSRPDDAVFTDERLREWVDLGAAFIGGCCGVGPSDISDLVGRLGMGAGSASASLSVLPAVSKVESPSRESTNTD